MNPTIFKYLIYIILILKSFIYPYAGFGINSGMNFFSVKASPDSYIRENKNTIAYVTNHGITNSLNIGAYCYFTLNNGDIDFEYNQLKKEYQFSFKNNLNTSKKNDTKLYNTNFVQKRFSIALNKYVLSMNFKPYIFSKAFCGFGLGIISSTPVIDNNFFKNNPSSFVFDGIGDPSLSNGTLSISKLNNQIINEPLIKYTSNFLLQTGYRIRLINLEIILLYRYELMNKKFHQNYLDFGTLKLRLGLHI